MDIYQPLESIMCKKSIITVSSNDRLSRVREIFKTHSFHHLPVVEEGMIKGIISKSDFLFFQKKTSNKWGEKLEDRRLDNSTAEDIMVKGIAVLEPSSSIATALKIFKENLFHAIPITEGRKLVGIVTTHDIIVKLLERNTTSA